EVKGNLSFPIYRFALRYIRSARDLLRYYGLFLCSYPVDHEKQSQKSELQAMQEVDGFLQRVHMPGFLSNRLVGGLPESQGPGIKTCGIHGPVLFSRYNNLHQLMYY